MKFIGSLEHCPIEAGFKTLVLFLKLRPLEGMKGWARLVLAACLLTVAKNGLSQASIGSAVDFAANINPVVTLQKEVGEVNLVLSVTDKKGRFVGGLLPSDLTIFDNNEKQSKLTLFQSQTDLPLQIALLVDVSSSVSFRFKEEQKTIYGFFKNVTRPSDSVFLMPFNEQVQMTVKGADDWKQIIRRIKQLKAVGDTAIYDAIRTGAAELTKDHRPSRRLLILLTDGQDNSSKATLEEAISFALKAEAAIYAINVNEQLATTEGRNATAILKQLADLTGGVYLGVKEDEDTSEAFSKIKRELRSQYVIAYKPTNIRQGFFHHLQVIAPAKLRVRCRAGYFVR